MPITLKGVTFDFAVAPERGGDILQITDVATGVSLLAVSPTSRGANGSSRAPGRRRSGSPAIPAAGSCSSRTPGPSASTTE
jgi:hypothetical protein